MSHILKIAIAEDDLELQRYYRAIVTRLGHSVVATASTGLQLVDAIESHQPELVITDLGMPECDGLEAIRRSPDGTRFIVISAADVSEEEEPLAEKIVARLTKPVDMAEIVDAIKNAEVGVS